SSRGGRGGRGSRGLRRGHPTRSYRPPFRRGGYVPGGADIMSKNRAIIEAMPQLPPVFASHPRTATTSGSFITPLFPSRSASVYSASSAATAKDFLTPQVRVPSPNPPGFYDPSDFHRLTRDQFIPSRSPIRSRTIQSICVCSPIHRRPLPVHHVRLGAPLSTFPRRQCRRTR
ncbi:hypothetical protein PTTG_30453, partial [Puccinia triticina 1-1 BBBD Race 1]